MRQHPWYQKISVPLIGLLLLVYPASMLLVRGGMNGVFLLLLLLSGVAAAFNTLPKIQWQKEWTLYVIAMFSMTLVILCSQIANQQYGAHAHDAATRYWLAIPIFLLLQRGSAQVFKALPLAFPLAAIAGFVMSTELADERAGVATLDLIHFGDYELLLAMLTLIGMRYSLRGKCFVLALQVAGVAAGIAASFASGSRGGWLLLPIMAIMFVYLNSARKWPKVLAVSGLLSVLMIGLLFATSHSFVHRIQVLVEDVSALNQGNRDTSIGVRWQLYHAALDVFVQRPVFGAGPEGFARQMQTMQEAGTLTPMAAELGRGEVHNDLLSKAAGMGILGALSLLAIFFIPLRLFWRACHSGILAVRQAGEWGVLFVVAHFVFGLSVEFLNLTLATAFYAFTVAVLLAACYNIHTVSGEVS